jgi:hypothetical protein
MARRGLAFFREFTLTGAVTVRSTGSGSGSAAGCNVQDPVPPVSVAFVPGQTKEVWR